MNSEKDKIILKFIQMLAIIRSEFRSVHIEIEKSPKIFKVETTVSPFETKDGDLKERVSLSVFLDAEVKNSSDNERQSLGISLTIKYVDRMWLAEGEIGWSGTSVGWDNYIDRQFKADDIEKFISRLPSFVADFLTLYRAECAKNF